jgi:hypothetical protein
MVGLRRKQKIILVLFSATTLLHPQTTSEPPVRTSGSLNGRAWNVFPESNKISYITGASEVLKVLDQKDFLEYFPWTLRAGEFVKAIDRFYAVPENLPIEIVFALKIVTMTANGEDPAVIEKSTAYLRRAASNPDLPK